MGNVLICSIGVTTSERSGHPEKRQNGIDPIIEGLAKPDRSASLGHIRFCALIIYFDKKYIFVLEFKRNL